MTTENTLKQDLTGEAKHSGVYMMRLLFREQCEMPLPAAIVEKLNDRFEEIETVSDKPSAMMFALRAHTVTYADAKQAPSQLLITGCTEITEPIGDAIARTQFWECPDGVELLDSCRYQIMISDFMAAGLPALERAEILADWLATALELFPTCACVYIDASGKLLTADSARNNPYNDARRFIWFGVNARFFNIQNTDDKLVDTLGLYALGLPDVQYHFHSLDPNHVVNHAYNIAIYQFENDAPVKSGETVGGIDPDDKWVCQYERSLIQPVRNVLDIEAGGFASGNRNHNK